QTESRGCVMTMVSEQKRFFYLEEADEGAPSAESTDDTLELLRAWDPKWAKAVSTLVQTTADNDALDPKLAALIQLNLAVSPTHLYAPAVRRQIRNALRLGATR